MSGQFLCTDSLDIFGRETTMLLPGHRDMLRDLLPGGFSSIEEVVSLFSGRNVLVFDNLLQNNPVHLRDIVNVSDIPGLAEVGQHCH